MRFRDEVQEQFRKAGWYEGRSVKDKIEKTKGFDLLPDILKEFLYEYGYLDVRTLTHVPSTLNMKIWEFEDMDIQEYVDEPQEFDEDIIVYPIGYYSIDNGLASCSEDGTVYMVHDFPGIMSDNFIEGIEKIIMEDYSNTLAWDEFENRWLTNEERSQRL